MRITDVSAYALSSPIEPVQERAFHGGVRRLLKRDFVLVVVETADGERGFAPSGASSSAMREHFEGASQREFADLIGGRIADAVEGESIEDPADVHDLAADADLPELLESQVGSALDVAVYDVLGKQQGAPIYELLGGADDATTDLPLYASAGMYMEPEGYAAQARTLADLGFFGYKYRPGIGPDADRRTVELIDDAVGDRAEIMIDAHTWWKMRDRSYGFEEVKSIVSDVAAHDVYWVEEPVEPDDYDGYVDLAEVGVPLAGGESEHSPEGLIDLAETGAVDFLQGDVRHHRGYTGTWETAEYCAGRDVSFVPHNFGTLLGLVANAHLVAAAPETELLEYPVFEGDPALDADDDPGMYPYPLAFDILEDGLDVEDGRFTVPDGPGLGVDVNVDAIEEYPFVEGAWSEFEYGE